MKTKLILYALMLGSFGRASAQNDGLLRIESFTSSGGGGTVSGGGYALTHAVGDPLVGDSGGGSHALVAGFWVPGTGSHIEAVNLALSLSPIVVTENIVRTFTLNVSNRGTAPATDLELVLNLPAGVRFQSAVSSAGSCQMTTGSVTCSAASLPGQSSFTVDVALRANFLPQSSGLSEIPGSLTASITAAETDFNSSDNSLTLPVTVQVQLDGGDAPGGFPVTFEEDGAHHRYSPAGPWLGARWDNDYHGNHSGQADWDDTHGGPDDEDGVEFVTPLVPGTPATVIVTATASGFMDAWADFNNDRDWTDPEEQLFVSQPLVQGANTLAFTVPVAAAEGTIFTRWRVSAGGGLSYTGFGGPGEVEDHPVSVLPNVELQAWRQTWFGAAANGVVAANGADPDGDTLTNLVEFAFGMNPANGESRAVAVSGNVVTAGTPVLATTQTSGGTEWHAMYSRRKNFAAAGLGFTVQVTSDLTNWTDSTAEPVVLADDGETEVVSVPLPLATSGSTGQFMRVIVSGP